MELGNYYVIRKVGLDYQTFILCKFILTDLSMAFSALQAELMSSAPL